MKHVGIFTATRWEFNAAQRILSVPETRRVGGAPCAMGTRGASRVSVMRTGIGPAHAGRVCRAVAAAQPVDLIVSAGFCCALVPARSGDLLIATEVVEDREGGSVPPVPCSADLIPLAVRAGERTGAGPRTGRFISVPRVIWRADEKRRLAHASGAIALDMESAALGRAAAAAGLPFLVLRHASDLLDEDLPLDFGLFLHPRGWLRGAIACLRPSAVASLQRLGAQSRTAAARMTAVLEAFFDELV